MEVHDDNTLTKVANALRTAGLTDMQMRDCVREMLNAGILFRELAKDDTPKKATTSVVHFVLLDGADSDDYLLFDCQVCRDKKMSDQLEDHARIMHGTLIFTVDTLTAMRKR